MSFEGVYEDITVYDGVFKKTPCHKKTLLWIRIRIQQNAWTPDQDSLNPDPKMCRIQKANTGPAPTPYYCTVTAVSGAVPRWEKGTEYGTCPGCRGCESARA
jgi:hypothetical protein